MNSPLILLIEAIDAELDRKRLSLVFTTGGKHDTLVCGSKIDNRNIIFEQIVVLVTKTQLMQFARNDYSFFFFTNKPLR